MSRRKNKGHIKTFQQRQTERRRRQESNQEQDIIEDLASSFSCSMIMAGDFAFRCDDRIDILDFDILCNSLALDFWASVPEHARPVPVLDALRELADEYQRHRSVVARLRELLLDLSKDEAIHQHLDRSLDHYRQQVRQALFPDLTRLASPELPKIK